MGSLWKPGLIKSIYVPGKFLIHGRFLLTNNRLTNSDKNDNDDCCRQSSSPPLNLPPPPCCTPPDPPVCCPAEPPVCCPTPLKTSCSSQHEQGKCHKPIEKSKKQYTLMMDLAKKGGEIIQLIGNSNEFDFAKEQIKKGLNLSFAYTKQYATLLKKNISDQLDKMHSKKVVKVEPKKTPPKQPSPTKNK